jgi:hypothetical protein
MNFHPKELIPKKCGINAHVCTRFATDLLFEIEIISICFNISVFRRPEVLKFYWIFIEHNTQSFSYAKCDSNFESK